MPNSNPLDSYNSFTNNTQIKFLHGPQSGINSMMTQGNAIEGAFYLADDTQKLYVGRKDSSNSNVYPVQVSRGVTIVTSTDELSMLSNGGIASDSFGAVEEGELYYVTANNILAALHRKSDGSGYEWVQVNPPTGITGLSFNATDVTINGIDVVESELGILTQASAQAQTKSQLFIGGNNVTINSNSIIDNNQTPPVTYSAIEISSKDTQYSVGANVATNGVTLGLYKDTETNFDSNVNLVSMSNSIGISYANNAIEINGPSLGALEIIDSPNGGFDISISELPGKSQASPPTPIANNINPIISYGKIPDKSSTNFISGTADLDVYTIEQTDNAIATAITEKLQTADALSYKGALNYDDAYVNAITYFTTHNVANGDVYKLSLDANQRITINGTIAKNGDLIIFNGRDTYQSAIDPSVFVNRAALYNYVDVVPSGDETELSIAMGRTQTGADFSFSNIVRGTDRRDYLLNVEIIGGDLISVAANVDSNADPKTITISHTANTQRTDINNYLESNVVGEPLTFNTGGAYKFFALASNSNEAIVTDGFGHVTGIKGKEIVFKHNRLTRLETSYGNQSVYGSSVTLGIDADDTIGSLSQTAAIDIVSDTLKFKSVQSTSNQPGHFAIDLVWGSFE